MQTFLKKFTVFAWSAAMLFAGIAAHQAQAAIVSGFSDVMTSQVSGQVSNHTLSFTTRSNAAEGSTMVVSFASSFDTSSIIANDVDVADDGVDLTLAANCGGAERASVIMVADALTITICAGDGGAIAAGSAVTIEIGTQATAQTAGSNRIVNPGSAGSYDITVGGTFGDRGRLSIGISSPGSVTVNGTVPGGGGGAGGGPPSQGDVTPPVISNVQVVDITEESATVTWQTNESSNSAVDYGLTSSYGSTVSLGSMVTSHRVPLSGLSAGTTYHVRVRSIDGSGNRAVSSDFTFTTLSAADSQPPRISDVQVINITGQSARVVWATDELATSRVDYGRTVGYEIGAVSDGRFVLDHAIDLFGLNPETTYHVRVRSTDASGNEAISNDLMFRTKDVIAPVITNLQVTDITETSARITWTTNELASSIIAYGTTIGYEQGTVSDGTLTVSHGITFVGLEPGTIYHFEARSSDASGNQGVSGDQTFTTKSDTTPPANVSNFTAAEPVTGTAHLTWRNPLDPDFAGVKIVRRTDRFPTGPNDGNTIFDGRAESTDNPGLVAGITYYYGAFAYDRFGNFASGALARLLARNVCGDNSCTAGETPEQCPADCPAPVPPVCGNNQCEQGETSETCLADCPLPFPVCGNNQCESGETAQNCPIDCPAPVPPVCGNTVCEAGEDNITCPADCPRLPPVSVFPSEQLDSGDIKLIVGNGNLTLVPANDRFTVLVNTPFTVFIPIDSFIREPQSVQFVFDGSTYVLVRVSEGYQATVLAPPSMGIFPAYLSITYPDGAADRVDITVVAEGYGRVIARIGGEIRPVSGATVTLLQADGAAWNALPFGQINPTITNFEGTFGWYVPNGAYQVRVEKKGFRTETLSLAVADNIVRPSITIIMLPPDFLESLRNILEAQIPLGEKALAITDLLSQQIEYGFGILDKEVLNNPEVERIARDIVAPALAVVATASAGVAVAAAGMGNLIQYLLTQPFLIFARRKRKAWGIVYNAVTKLPVDLAVVRLREAETNALLQTRVTDRDGRYFFIAQPGSYRIEVFKQGFRYPTETLKEERRDEVYLDLYHGETVTVTERDATIAANIPVDPDIKEQTPTEIRRKILVRRLGQTLGALSPVIAGVAAVISPTRFTIGLFVFQIVLYTATKFAIRTPKPKGWGIVYDAKTGHPLTRAVVRIFEPKYGKLLETQITDDKGRYSFLAGPSKYHVAAQKEGYQTQTLEIDYSTRHSPEVVTKDVRLDPEKQSEQWQDEPLPEESSSKL